MKKEFILSNGKSIPSIGFGTWQSQNGETAQHAVEEALKCGYHHIDTAAIYGNEQSVGMGIKNILDKGMLTREELFVTSKVWNSARGYDTTLRAFRKSLQDLKLEYLDLYLIHWPASPNRFENWKAINSDTWKALETLYQDGLVKAIGVSNFYVNHLEALSQQATVLPMVDQIEYHPGQTQPEVVQYCHEHDVLVEAWSPLGTGRLLSNDTLMTLSNKYGKSVAQLCIRWVMQNGLLPLPKSVTPSRIKENIEVFDFEISEEDMATINQMEAVGGSGLHPDKVDF